MTQTSWESVSDWYRDYVGSAGTYQADLILPNLLRVLSLKHGERVLDLGCGEGFFARAFHSAGARVSGIDASPSLIRDAKRNSPKGIDFRSGNAEQLPPALAGSYDTVVMVLSLQNMESYTDVLREARRVLNGQGRIVIVMSHPAFRIPDGSDWAFEDGVQYRRISRYLSRGKKEIVMHPGTKRSATTTTFHRSLQDYMKALRSAGFALTRLEEWVSPKTSEPGPRASAENRARAEIPLFLLLEACILS
jgi:ubiquinone/menaquinone biosynthesis C-methylase UbiE